MGRIGFPDSSLGISTTFLIRLDELPFLIGGARRFGIDRILNANMECQLSIYQLRDAWAVG